MVKKKGRYQRETPPPNCENYLLTNGWVAQTGWNSTHGEYIRALWNPKIKDVRWLACNGDHWEEYNELRGSTEKDRYIPLPDFAQEWKDKYNLVRLPENA